MCPLPLQHDHLRSPPQHSAHVISSTSNPIAVKAPSLVESTLHRIFVNPYLFHNPKLHFELKNILISCYLFIRMISRAYYSLIEEDYKNIYTSENFGS